jgi:hypothetical protein
MWISLKMGKCLRVLGRKDGDLSVTDVVTAKDGDERLAWVKKCQK